MFKFDFKVEVDSDSTFCKGKSLDAEQSTGENVKQNVSKQEIDWYAATEVSISADVLENLDVYKLNAATLPVDNITIEHVVTGFLLEHIKTNSDESQDIAKAEETHTDLIPGIYEGGAKIWECTTDLLEYLAANFKATDWQEKHVLDLGCGAGLLGIYAYKCGAIVHFQDYNKDVLTQITIPNVLLNVPETATDDTDGNVDVQKLSTRVKFYAGDWRKYVSLTAAGADSNSQFDFILSSETIYNSANQQKLLDTLHAKLRPNGVVLVAAKTYYFGVGGGLRQFESLVIKDKRFTSRVLWMSTEGVGREILELKLL